MKDSEWVNAFNKPIDAFGRETKDQLKANIARHGIHRTGKMKTNMKVAFKKKGDGQIYKMSFTNFRYAFIMGRVGSRFRFRSINGTKIEIVDTNQVRDWVFGPMAKREEEFNTLLTEMWASKVVSDVMGKLDTRRNGKKI